MSEDEEVRGWPIIGQVVREYRESRRWTQDEIAERSGQTPGMVSKVERARQNVEVVSVRRLIEEGLELDEAEFFERCRDLALRKRGLEPPDGDRFTLPLDRPVRLRGRMREFHNGAFDLVLRAVPVDPTEEPEAADEPGGAGEPGEPRDETADSD